jgi:hypothetical protein
VRQKRGGGWPYCSAPGLEYSCYVEEKWQRAICFRLHLGNFPQINEIELKGKMFLLVFLGCKLHPCLFSVEFICCLGEGKGSRVSSGSIVSDYGLDDQAIGVRSPEGAKDFSSILCVQTGSGAHPASCTMGTGGPFSGGKSAAGACR